MIGVTIAIGFEKNSVLHTVSIFEMCDMPMFGRTGGLQNGKVKR